jgi:FkbM family methyltransferase
MFGIKTRLTKRDYKKSYAQSGEDLLLDFVLNEMQIKKPTYLDLGAHHPTYLSNTYLFYRKGCVGVSVEPDPYLYEQIVKKRPRDTNLNIGVGLSTGKAKLYILTTTTLNTFSKEEAERYTKFGKQKIDKGIDVPTVPVDELIKKHLNGRAPDIFSLDIEGMDLEILKSLDLKRFRPKTMCIETITYTEDNNEQKVAAIIEYLKQHGYIVYADTYINTIFVDKDAWLGR